MPKMCTFVIKRSFLTSFACFELTACLEGTFGAECSQNCTCNTRNTVACNTTSGECQCEPGWTGAACGTDVDECAGSSPVCPQHSNCTDTDGSFLCLCETGYYKNSTGMCEGSCIACWVCLGGWGVSVCVCVCVSVWHGWQLPVSVRDGLLQELHRDV